MKKILRQPLVTACVWIVGWTFLCGAAANSCSPYGVIAGSGRRWLDGTNGKPDAYQKAHEAGIRWVQLFFRWYELEPADCTEAGDPTCSTGGPCNCFRFDDHLPASESNQQGWCPATGCLSADERVAEAVAAGLSINVQVWGTPGWAAEPGCNNAACPPRDNTGEPDHKSLQFEEFMRVLANRYADKVAAWSLWSEQDQETGAYWNSGAASFRNRILKSGYDGVKAAASGPRIVGTGGLLYPTPAALDLWVKEGGVASGPIVRNFEFIGIDVLKENAMAYNNTVSNINDWALANTLPNRKPVNIWILGGGVATSSGCGCQLQDGSSAPGRWTRQLTHLCTHTPPSMNRVRRIFMGRLHDAVGACNSPSGNTCANVGCKLGLLTCAGAVTPRYDEVKDFITGPGGDSNGDGNFCDGPFDTFEEEPIPPDPGPTIPWSCCGED